VKWYIKVLSNYALFSGRARRKEYWYFFLCNLLIGFVLALIDQALGLYIHELGLGFLGFLYALAVFVPGAAVTIRRLHDTGRSAWWLLILLVPVIGAIVFLVFMVLDSEAEENKYGQSPKTVPA